MLPLVWSLEHSSLIRHSDFGIRVLNFRAMSQRHIESDPLFQLLTDALRAGPESTEWREAVARVAERGEAADEFALLYRARERLAQGKEYKSIRPGPTFTRKVMGKIEEEASQVKKGVPWANVIAVISALAMAGVIAAVAYMLVSRPSDSSTPETEVPASLFSHQQDQ